MRKLIGVWCVVLVQCLMASPAWAWWESGHELATKQAVRYLPDDVPAFFRVGETVLLHYCGDPDMMRMRELPQLRAVERPEHFFDAELMPGFTEDLAALPRDRHAYLALLAKHDVPADHAGTLPYALLEWTQRLTFAFAEHRRWPDDPIIQQKCLTYAGLLAHYAQDATMPLHLTVEYDGRLNEAGATSESGIHEKIDSLATRLSLADLPEAAPRRIRAFDDPFEGVRAQLVASRAKIDAAYDLEPRLPPAMDLEPLPEAVKTFAVERFDTAGHFTASLYYTAWRLSGTVAFPSWHRRDAE